MRRSYVLWVAVWLLLACGVLPGQSGQDFDSFYSAFRSAVAQKDKAKLTSMMASPFEYFKSTGVAPDAVFDSLDANGGQQWNNLEQSIAAPATVLAGGYGGRPARVVQCHATQVHYTCSVVFQQDDQRRWRWKGMIMTTFAEPPVPEPPPALARADGA